jgi:Uncharacterized conserved protein
MDARLSYFDNTIAMNFAKYINSAGAVVTGSALPAATQELVKIRASQINGCCRLHRHAHQGRPARRGNPRAAQPGRGVAGGEGLHRGRAGRPGAHRAGHPHRRCRRRVTDEAWANAAKHYDDDQLAALVALIALINTYNRMNVITQQPAGDYQPGQWG